VRRRICD
jgi:hypothetical protein